jgi:UbiD family decarboxylase
MSQSLRSTLSYFEQINQLHYIDRPVDPRYELGAILSLRRYGPTVVFRNVTGYDISVVGNLLNTRMKIAQGIGVKPQQVQKACVTALNHGIEPEIVSEGQVQEVIHGNPIDFSSLLPIPTWFERERGPYITAGVIVAKDPETGRRNVSIARLRVEGKDLLMAGIAPTHHLSQLMQRAQAQGKSLEIAVAIGNHPAVLIASQMYVELGHDEFEIAGGLLGEALRLVRCQSVDVEVPAEAEIVLEGTLHVDERIEEGPVSEFHGFYEYYKQGYAVRIKRVTHRRNPKYQAILPGYAPEHVLVGGVAIEAVTYRALQKVIPSVRRVLITEGGMGRTHAIITMHKPQLGEGKRAIMLAMGQTNPLKLVIVVDDDIDPEDWNQVEWALSARMRGEEDIMIIPGVMADRFIPQQRNLTITKIGIVATTRPGDGEPGGKFELACPPKAVSDQIRHDLNKY